MSKKITWVFLLGAMFLMLCSVIYNSMTRVREYDDPQEMIVQRILVQPAELWWVTWDRMVVGGEWTPDLAWELMFEDPYDASRNTGIQYLMIKAIGYKRAEEILSLGGQYAGGYPEVLFELVGPYLAILVALLFGLITAFLLRIIVVAVCRGNFGTVFMGIYVFYGFTLLYIGGMLNFLVTPIFWLKIATFVLVYWFEITLYKQRRRLFIDCLSRNYLQIVEV